MKTTFFRPVVFMAMLSLVIFSCKKDEKKTWTAEQKASYQAVITLQDQAAVNYNTWSLTLDSLTVIAQLKQFFLNDPSVLSAEINSQGIVVKYANGMGGGFFLNPKDYSINDTMLQDNVKAGARKMKSTPLVNDNSMILIDAHYWDRQQETDYMVTTYNQWLPNAGYTLSKTYFNSEADIDRFTRLSGFGIVQIYSHGMAWPDEGNIQHVYIYTGEEANEVTSENYYEDIFNKNILILESESPVGIINRYFISDEFLTKNNDFSKDTVLFVGSFCYSFLGKMPEISQSFGAGVSVGFDWSVWTNHCVKKSVSLVTSMCDPVFSYPISSAAWFHRSQMMAFDHYFDDEDNRTVWIKGTGDTTYLWKIPPAEAETWEASDISPTSASLNAKVKPVGFDTRVWFEYGLTNDYTGTTPVEITWSGSSWNDINAMIIGLIPSTIYHYRIRTKNDMGTSLGEDKTFETLALGMPTATTLEATNITAYTATLNGRINPNGVTAYGEFEYGETTAYGNYAPINENPVNGDQPIDVSYNLQGLVSGQTYHFRFNAYHQGYVDIVYGEDKTFVAQEGGVQVGQEYQGGIVFAVEPNGLHGLIALQSDLSTAEWGCYQTALPGADGLLYGTGMQNTLDIISGCPIPGIAAVLCNDLTLNGYDDWFLPSATELYSMLAYAEYNSNLGGFVQGGYYWSSSEYDANSAYLMQLGGLNYTPAYKNQAYNVRPIRAF